ncbi:MAG: ArsR/SmtB family transcription factor [Parvibaculaceae bacterium]
MSKLPFDPALLKENASNVADLLGGMANARRLEILCHLSKEKEATVNALAEAVGLSASATSQHLTKMREEGLVAFRKERQTVWYRIGDPRIEQLLRTLQRLFCLS